MRVDCLQPPPEADLDLTAGTDLTAALLRPVHGTNAFEAAVERLATAIQLGVFGAGDRLPPERELASALRVSRSTLREAIAALRQAGLVSTRTGRGGGTVVRPPSIASPGDDLRSDELHRRAAARRTVEQNLEKYRDTLVVRRIVEPGAAALAAERDLTAEQRQWLRVALEEVSEAADPVPYRRSDSRLHLAIASLSGSLRLLEMVTRTRRELLDLLDAIPVLEVNIAHSNRQHRRIVEAILDGDHNSARLVMQSHCDASASLLRGLLGLGEPLPRRNGRTR